MGASIRRYLTPLGLVAGDAAGPLVRSGAARPLGNTGLAFTALSVATRREGGGATRDIHSVATLPAEFAGVLAEFEAALAGLADDPLTALGLPADRPLVMGIVNTTPDSFSDGGRHLGEAGIAHGRALAAAGADILDIGGESTRPGAEDVPVAEELDRVVPVIRGLAGIGIPISVDTRKAAVMEAALDAGAAIVNDVSALGHDPAARALVARRDVPVILMHAQGQPKTMQADPRYDDVLLDLHDWFRARLDWCREGGIAHGRTILDPGIGFGKTVAHNVALMDSLPLFFGLGRPLLLAASRKRFIASLSDGEGADRRLGGSLAAALAGIARGARLVRVHDVAETAQALRVARAIAAAGTPRG